MVAARLHDAQVNANALGRGRAVVVQLADRIREQLPVFYGIDVAVAKLVIPDVQRVVRHVQQSHVRGAPALEVDGRAVHTLFNLRLDMSVERGLHSHDVIEQHLGAVEHLFGDVTARAKGHATTLTAQHLRRYLMRQRALCRALALVLGEHGLKAHRRGALHPACSR